MAEKNITHQYKIVPKDPGAHLFEVTLTVAKPDPSGQEFRVPAWIPGSYLIRDFARNLISIRADSEGPEIALLKSAFYGLGLGIQDRPVRPPLFDLNGFDFDPFHLCISAKALQVKGLSILEKGRSCFVNHHALDFDHAFP